MAAHYHEPRTRGMGWRRVALHLDSRALYRRCAEATRDALRAAREFGMSAAHDAAFA